MIKKKRKYPKQDKLIPDIFITSEYLLPRQKEEETAAVYTSVVSFFGLLGEKSAFS